MYRQVTEGVRSALYSAFLYAAQRVPLWRGLRAGTRCSGLTSRAGRDPQEVTPSLAQRIMEVLPVGPVTPTVLDTRPGSWDFSDCVYPGRDVRVVAFDPLADGRRAPEEAGGPTPRANGQALPGEERLRGLASDTFDVVLARDWVDRCLDLRQAIWDMVRIARRGGCALLEHCDEKRQGHEGGVHRWVLSINHANELIIRSREYQMNVSRELAPMCHVACQIFHDPCEDWLCVRIAKREAPHAP